MARARGNCRELIGLYHVKRFSSAKLLHGCLVSVRVNSRRGWISGATIDHRESDQRLADAFVQNASNFSTIFRVSGRETPGTPCPDHKTRFFSFDRPTLWQRKYYVDFPRCLFGVRLALRSKIDTRDSRWSTRSNRVHVFKIFDWFVGRKLRSLSRTFAYAYKNISRVIYFNFAKCF